MRIGILTFTGGTNLGQRLQNYALQQVLSGYGHEVYTIVQGTPYNETKYRIKTALQRMGSQEGAKARRREKKFNAFNRRCIRFYPEKMPFYGDNSAFAKAFDAFVVGSDQVWSPLSPDVGENFFLPFAAREQRLTYAPSLSVEEIPKEKQALYRRRLEGFDRISIREDRGAQLIEALTGQHAEVVLDPTLLLDTGQWNAVRRSYDGKPEGKYALAVFLGGTPSEQLGDVCLQTGLPLFSVGVNTPAAPDEILDAIASAELVLTDSYHITAFAVQYRRPFINFSRSGTSINMNSRFQTLYRMLDIKGREWQALRSHPEAMTAMDYSAVYCALDEQRVRSRAFLEESLASVGRQEFTI